jgi:hypothetical protein
MGPCDGENENVLHQAHCNEWRTGAPGVNAEASEFQSLTAGFIVKSKKEISGIGYCKNGVME